MDRVIRPNVGKVLVVNILRTLFVIFIGIAILVVLHLSIGLETFAIALEIFKISVSLSNLLFALIVLMLAAFLIVIIASLLSVVRLKYVFGSEKMSVYKPVLLFTSTKDISYRNITRVTFENDDIFNRLLNTGHVSLDLSNMGEKDLKMKYVDRPTEVANFVSEVIRAYQLKVQAEYTAKYRIRDILDKGGI